jgi:hypothetical protein
MSVRQALATALRDLYAQSWRLLVVNGVVGASVVAVAVAAAHERAALAAVVVLGLPAAAMVHCAVTLARGGDLRLADALAGLRLSWRRGLALAAVAAALAPTAGYAVAFYGSARPLLWPLSFLVLYLSIVLGVHQLLLWTLAIGDATLPLHKAAAQAFELLLRRPLASLGLGLSVALVNIAGVVAALMPFLTLTLSYTFLAAAHFVFPPIQEEVPSCQASRSTT